AASRGGRAPGRVNDKDGSAGAVLGDQTLRTIAQELVRVVRNNVTIDWTVRENVRAHLRILVKRILRRNGYPPDKQERATQTVLEQAEVLCREWAGNGAIKGPCSPVGRHPFVRATERAWELPEL